MTKLKTGLIVITFALQLIAQPFTVVFAQDATAGRDTMRITDSATRATVASPANLTISPTATRDIAPRPTVDRASPGIGASQNNIISPPASTYYTTPVSDNGAASNPNPRNVPTNPTSTTSGINSVPIISNPAANGQSGGQSGSQVSPNSGASNVTGGTGTGNGIPVQPPDKKDPMVNAFPNPQQYDTWMRGKGPRIEMGGGTGDSAYTYPIEVPPGRKGMQPSLALSYNSGNRDNFGAFGYGWSLETGYIVRDTRKGNDQLYKENDFSLNIFGDRKRLKPISLTDGVHGVYGEEIENDYYQVQFNNNNSWLVTDKNGTTYLFGSTPITQQSPQNDQTKIYKWMLEEIRDANDNFMRFTYVKDGNQIYPKSIFYTGSGTTDGVFEVEFITEARPDGFDSNVPQFKIVNNFRVSEIQVKANGAWRKKYALAYDIGANSKRSLLKSVTETGKDDQGNLITMPSTTFDYNKKNKGWNYDASWKLPVYFMDNPTSDSGARFVDVNGDGFVDIVRALASVGGGLPDVNDVFINTGSGWVLDKSWQTPYSIIMTGVTQGYSDTGVRFADFNADGLPDVVHAQVNTADVFINTGKGWKLDPTWQFPTAITGWDSKPLGVQIADVNGDGFVDVIHAQGDVPHEVFISDGKGKWPKDAKWQFPADFSATNNPDDGTRLIDVNGDGLIDVVWARTNGNGDMNYVWLNTGTGWTMDPTRKLPELFIDAYGYDAGVRLADVNGDGLTDMVKGGGNITNSPIGSYSEVFLNTGKNWKLDPNWKLPLEFNATGGAADSHGGMLADVNGDGLSDIVDGKWDQGEQNWDSIYINNPATAGVVDDLLVNISESKGAKTSLTYKPSPFYKTAQGGNLNGDLYIPIQTVNTVKTDDGMGGVTTDTYTYAGGSYYVDATDSHKNAFAGFGQVTVAHEDGTSTKTFYFQGKKTNPDDHYAKIGRAYKQEVYAADGSVVKKTFYAWTVDKLAGTDRYGLKLASNLDIVFDGSGGGAGPQKASAVGYAYDPANGNVTQEMYFGEVTADSATGIFSDSGNDKKVSLYAYAVDPAGKVRAAVSQKTLQDGSGAKLAETRFFYDGAVVASVAKGNITRKDAWINVKNAYTSRTYANDKYGNQISETDAFGNVTKTTYDALNIYPATVTNPKNQVVTMTYDSFIGRPTQITEANNVTLKITYDAFARPVQNAVKHTSLGADFIVTKAFSYNDQTMPHVTKALVYDGNGDMNGAQESYAYENGHGLMVQTRRKMANGNYAVTRTDYDKKQRINSVSFPAEESGSGYTGGAAVGLPGAAFTYDALDRVLTTTTPAGKNTFEYHGWNKTAFDANNHKKIYHYDAFNQLVAVDEFWQNTPYTTAYQYDGAGNLIKLTDAKGNVRNFVYDSMGRRTAAEDVHSPTDSTFGTRTYVYDDNGNLTKQTNADGKTIVYTYDALNRVTSEDLSDTAGVETTYTYDTGANGIGLLAKTQMKYAVSSYDYDAMGNVTKEIRTIKDVSFTTTAKYDLLGRTIYSTSPNILVTLYTYGVDGLLKIDRKSPSNNGPVAVMTNKTYSPAGQVLSADYSNGDKTVYTYDAANRLKTKKTTNGANIYQSLTYEYDPVGNITKMTEGATTQTAKQAIYTYDELDRLAGATTTNTAGATGELAPYTFAYTYDILGNILTKPLAGNYSYDQTGYANPHAVTKITGTINGQPVTETFDYDKNGNLIQDAARTLFWNSKNELQGVITKGVGGAGPTNFNFLYDPTGNRIYKASIAGSTTYVNKSFEVESSPSGDKKTERNYLYDGDQLVATVETLTQTTPPPPGIGDTKDTLLVENFDDAVKVKKNWSIQGGIWVTNGDGTYGESNTPNAKTYRQVKQYPAKGRTFTYAWKQTFNSLPTGKTGINDSGAGMYMFARAPGLPHGRYSYLVFQDSIAVHLYRAKIVKGATIITELAVAPFSLAEKGLSHAYKVDYTSDTGLVQVYMDGGVLISVKDPSPLVSIGGYVMLFNNGARVKFDDLSVISLTKVPQGEPQPPQVTTTSVVSHSHPDHLGSSSVVTGGLAFDGTAADTTGGVIEEMDTYPYGETKIDKKATTFGSKKKFTGKELDTDTGLYYYGARYYDTRLGRFVSEDPSFLSLTDSRSLVGPQGWNSYSYVLNNPVRYTDPSGGQAADATMRWTSFSVGGFSIPITLGAVTAIGLPAVAFAPMYGDTPAWTHSTISSADISSAQSTDQAMLQRLHNASGAKPVAQADSLIGTKGFGSSIKAKMRASEGGGGTVGPGGMGDDDKNGGDYKARVNQKIYNNLERQLERDGKGSIFRSLKSAKEALREHIIKLQNAEYKSAIEKTIRNVSDQIKTIEHFINNKGL